MSQPIKVSIVIAVLNSHKVVVRQIRHFKKMNLPDSVEIIFVDDGSDPPLSYQNCGLKNFYIYFTNDKRPWTQGLARNLGASKAQGEFLFFTDIDHIITKEAIEDVLEFEGDRMTFVRRFGILNRFGDIVSDEQSMLEFGLNPLRLKGKRRGTAGTHGNTYAIRKSLFDLIGGYDSRFCQSGFHVGGKYMSEERKFNLKWVSIVKKKLALGGERMGADIYHYPVSKFRTDGDNNPRGLFHGLSLKQPQKGGGRC